MITPQDGEEISLILPLADWSPPLLPHLRLLDILTFILYFITVFTCALQRLNKNLEYREIDICRQCYKYVRNLLLQFRGNRYFILFSNICLNYYWNEILFVGNIKTIPISLKLQVSRETR